MGKGLRGRQIAFNWAIEIHRPLYQVLEMIRGFVEIQFIHNLEKL